MNLIEQEHSFWGECPTDLEESILWIERAGRVCYRSEDKIIEGSGRKFVNGITKRNHWSVIEHSNMVIRSPRLPVYPLNELIKSNTLYTSKFLHSIIHKGYIYTGGNFRAWMEDLKLHTIDDLFLFHGSLIVNKEDVPRALKRVTVEFVTDRAVTHELVRHRPASYSQESQRYVRYGNINFVKPAWYNKADSTEKGYFEVCCSGLEEYYKWFVKTAGMKAEDARVILPNCTATRIVMTASLPEWDIVFNLRGSKAAYPQIRNLILPVQEEFQEKVWV